MGETEAYLHSRWSGVTEELKAVIQDTESELIANPGEAVITALQQNFEATYNEYWTKWEEFEVHLNSNTDADKTKIESFCREHRCINRNANKCKLQIAKSIDNLRSKAPQPTYPTSPPQVHFKLPHIKLPEFSGEIDQWPQFWELFEGLVDNRTDLPVTVKFNYLRNVLKGQSAKLVSGFTVTEQNYEQAKDLLKKTYQDKDRCRRKLTGQLFDLKGPRHDAKEIRNFKISYNQILRSLEAYADVGSSNWMIVELLIKKLSKETLEYVYNYHKTQYFDLEELDEALETLVDVLENSRHDSFKSSNNETKAKKSESDHHEPKSKVVWQAAARNIPSCEFCSEAHYANQCPTYLSREERKSCLKMRNRCLLCGRTGHYANNCRVKTVCFLCKGSHWTGLCPGSLPENPPTFTKTTTKTQKPSTASASKKVPDRVTGKGKEQGELSKNESHKNTENTVNQSVAVKTAVGDGGRGVALPTALITVGSKERDSGRKKIRSFFDTGAQKSFIHPDVIKELGLQPKKYTTIQLLTFGQEPVLVECPLIDLTVSLGRRVAKVEFLVTDRVGTTLSSPGLTATVASLKQEGFKLADKNASDRMHDIQAVIGSDNFSKFINGIKTFAGINLLCSPGGHIIYGALPCDTFVANETNCQSVVVSKVCIGNCETDARNVIAPTEPKVELLWELETIGIREENYSPDERNALRLFGDSIQYCDDQYWVKFPWKLPPKMLPTNYRMAVGQYNSLKKHLEQNPDKLLQYDQVLKDYLAHGFIEKVNEPEIKGHYLPHHAVLKKSNTTPLRIVFNASAKSGPHSLSLNEALETGPSLTQKLVDSLVNFRTNKYGITADISKAFLRVGLKMEDRDYVRFLWQDISADPHEKTKFDQEYHNSTVTRPQTFRFRAVPFGTTASPFLLQATLCKHLENSDSPLKQVLLKSLYVDNFQATANNVSELHSLYTEASRCLAEANMPLHGWNSSCIQYNNSLNEDREICTSVLGILWDTHNDFLSVKSVPVEDVTTLTKRKALSISSKVYDPLGLLSPITIRSKLFISQLWKSKLGWDEVLNSELIAEFNHIIKDFSELESIAFPRGVCLKSEPSTLHVFCDASSRAYGAVAYISNGHSTNLLMSRSRLAPVKEKTIPQLELTALVVGCRIAAYIVETLNLEFQIYMWSDSSTCVHWVDKNNSNKVYVRNRVGEILTLRDQIKFEIRHVDSKDNPADLISRGCSIETLRSSALWNNGPQWLNSETDWPETQFKVSMNEIITQNIPIKPTFNIFPIENYSSLSKVINVTDLVFKFLKQIKLGKVCTQSSSEYWLKNQQRLHYPLVYEALQLQSHENKYNESRKFISDLSLFLDDQGIIRSRGRIDNAETSYSMKNPILLPPKSYLCKLLVDDRHCKNHHAGIQETLSSLREEFWIPRGRQCIKQVLKNCVVCKYDLKKAFKYPGPPGLPKERVTFNRPFQHCGVDYTGALKLKNDSGEYVKFYICLFTCAATRAVHLELIHSLSAEAFLLCLRRFVARYSLPDKLISDNGTNFVAVNKFLVSLKEDEEVKNYLKNHKLNWYFISPRAPWQGGMYERLIGVVKSSLHKALHNRQVTEAELRTILTEIEAVVNNRPLTYVGDDIKSLDTITPSHLLYGRKIFLYPQYHLDQSEVEFVDNVNILHNYHNKLTQIVKKFTKLWSLDYLQSLREKHYSPELSSVNPPKKGEIVIVAAEPDRSRWTLGRIVDLVKGSDNAVREVLVDCNGHLSRKTVEKLIPLELEEIGQESKNLNPDCEENANSLPELVAPENNVRLPSTRPKRKAAKVADEWRKTLIQNELV